MIRIISVTQKLGNQRYKVYGLKFYLQLDFYEIARHHRRIVWYNYEEFISAQKGWDREKPELL